MKNGTLALLVASSVFLRSPSPGQSPAPGRYVKQHTAGNVLRVVWDGVHMWGWSNTPFCEYPPQSGIEHVRPWVGRFELAALAPPGDTLDYLYLRSSDYAVFSPVSRQPWDTIWAVTDNMEVDIPYWPSYQGVSDEDFVLRYKNDQTCWGRSNVGGRSIPIGMRPLYLSVVEQSFAWNTPPMNDVVVSACHITPTRFDLRGVFLVLRFYGGIGPFSRDPTAPQYDRFDDDYSRYFREEHLGIVNDGPYGPESQLRSPIGYKLFPPRSIPPSSLRWTFQDDYRQWEPLLGMADQPESAAGIRTEAERTAYMYRLVSSTQDFYISSNRGSGYLSVGPLSISVGDTLTFWTAEILGNGDGDIIEKARLLDSLYARSFHTPKPPPPPRVRVERAPKTITLRWNALPGEPNPETYTDPYRGDRASVPFEGYRVYKSYSGPNGPWILLKEFDIPGDGYGKEQGLQREFVDTGLLDNLEYYYAVTAFSKEDRVFGFAPRETRIALSTVEAVPGVAPSRGVGEVSVVPNPYRNDVLYNQYRPTWEPPTTNLGTWIENDRRIQFVHLPAHCEIRIFTLAGDLVRMIRHDNESRSHENWNLTSSVNQAVSGGIYLFTVQDDATGAVQTGKFVILK